MDISPPTFLVPHKGNPDQNLKTGLGTNIVNLSDKKLSTTEKSLLDKGLNFIPVPTKINKSKILQAVSDLGRKIKLAYVFRDGTKFSRKKTKFVNKSKWTPPDNKINKAVLEKIDQMVQEIQQLRIEKEYPNLKTSELRALKKLKNNMNIIIKPADKGSATVIMNKKDYISEANRQLNNPKHYKKICSPVYPETSKTLKTIIKSLQSKGYLTKQQVEYLNPEEKSRPRHFYMLPKIHKTTDKWTVPGKIPPGRPIISDCSSESYKISEYVDHHLAPLATSHPSFVKDTQDFISKISELEIPKDAMLVTLDVDSLYTNINNKDGIKAVANKLRETPGSNRPDKQLLELLEISLLNNDFEFNGQWYLQIFGTAMGKKFAPNYANIFMAQWEQEALSKCHKKPLLYLRYLDDIFIIWTHSEAEFQSFFETLNQHHESIKLKSTVSHSTIDFLDVTVFKGPRFDKENILDTKVYFKPTDTHQLLHKLSFHPKHTFSGIVKSQFLRYNRICNNQADFEEACNILIHALRPRGYSKRFLRTIKSNTLKQIQDEINRGPRASRGQATSCKRSRCKTCSHVDTKSEFQSNSTGEKFEIKQMLNCDSHNVIYLISCKKCGIQYVGKTETSLGVRFTQHKSAIRNEYDKSVPIHFNQPDHSLDHCQIIPIEQVQVCLDNKSNTEAIRKREDYWIECLNTVHPHGLNRTSQQSKQGLLPLVIPYSSTAPAVSKIVRKHYEELQTSFSKTFKAKFITAYSRNPNLKDSLVSSKMK